MAKKAFETFSNGNNTPILFVCDHASNRVPEDVNGGDLGLPEAEMGRHIAFDIGVRGLTLELAKIMSGVVVASTFSRLVIDPNRGEDDPTLIMQLYDGTLVPGNRYLDGAERQRRLETLYRPYHAEVSAQIDGIAARATQTPILVSIHSFTPKLKNRPFRPWELGVLSAEDRRIAEPLLAAFRAEEGLTVGDNEPYHGKLEGDCMDRHGIQRGLPHALIEIRQDLIATPETEILWARRLAPILTRVFNDFWEKDHRDG